MATLSMAYSMACLTLTFLRAPPLLGLCRLKTRYGLVSRPGKRPSRGSFAAISPGIAAVGTTVSHSMSAVPAWICCCTGSASWPIVIVILLTYWCRIGGEPGRGQRDGRGAADDRPGGRVEAQVAGTQHRGPFHRLPAQQRAQSGQQVRKRERAWGVDVPAR